MDFPHGRLDYETLTTLNFFENVHEIINVKIHLHHLHVTGKIIAYAHDFCNMKVRENQNQSSCIAHSFFGFDRFFLMKGIRLSVWGTKDKAELGRQILALQVSVIKLNLSIQ